MFSIISYGGAADGTLNAELIMVNDAEVGNKAMKESTHD